MISLSEFMKIIPQKKEILDIHVMEGEHQFDIETSSTSDDTLGHPWHEYHVISCFSLFDQIKKDSKICLTIVWDGEDENA